jgi:uncharacterized protein (DUF1697 family)
MKTRQFVALLRGVNVGGNNIIRMADLKACLEKAGFAAVATVIQSGNVLLESGEHPCRLHQLCDPEPHVWPFRRPAWIRAAALPQLAAARPAVLSRA